MAMTDDAPSEDLCSAQADDLVLLSRYAKTGDAEAFQSLVERYQNLVWSACRRILRDPADVEDASQNVFLALAKNAASIESNLAAWLHSTAVNCSTSLVRSAVARRRREQQRAENLVTAEEEQTWREVRELIDVCLAELGDDDRELIIQRFYRGMTQLEIAEQLGIGQQAVSVRLRKAVEHLRGALKSRSLPVTTAVVAGALKTGLAEASAPAQLTASLAKIGISGVGYAKTSAGIGLTTMAKGALVIIPAVLCLLAAWSIWGPNQPQISSVLTQLDTASSIQYTITRVNSLNDPVGLIQPQDILDTWTERHQILEGYLERAEGLGGVDTGPMIANYRTGEVVALNLQAKTYTTNIRFWPGQNAGLGDPDKVGQYKLAPQTELANYLVRFSSDDVERLAARDPDGRELVGYRTESTQGRSISQYTLWVDRQSMRPVRMTSTYRNDHPAVGSSDWIHDNFVYDAELPQSLFSTDPPAGFTLKNPSPTGREGENVLDSIPLP